MTTRRARRRIAPVITFVLTAGLAAVLTACRAKEPAPQASTAPPTTIAAPVTTPPPPTTVPTPPPVWREARWGMTRDEVLAAFPNEAQRLAAPTEFGAPQVGTSDVAIPSYDLDGTKFRVLFGFQSETLNRIQLSAAKAGDDTCSEVEKSLTAKHSAPAQRENTGTSLRGQQMTWKLPDQTIVLGCAGVRSLGFQSVTLDFWAPSTTALKEPASPSP
jgi:hypothetical protein